MRNQSLEYHLGWDHDFIFMDFFQPAYYLEIVILKPSSSKRTFLNGKISDINPDIGIFLLHSRTC